MPCQIIIRNFEKINDSTVNVVWSTFAPECMCGETVFNRRIKDVDINSLYKVGTNEFDRKKLKIFLLEWMDNNDD